MSCKNWHRLCYFMIVVLLMAGMYTTYVKADDFAERAAAISIIQYSENINQTTRHEIKSGTVSVWIEKNSENVLQDKVCIVGNANQLIRTVIGRVTSRGYSIRRDLRVLTWFLWGLCVAYFLLNSWKIEEILCLHEKKYRAALLKYIHDKDGKKRMSCLA